MYILTSPLLEEAGSEVGGGGATPPPATILGGAPAPAAGSPPPTAPVVANPSDWLVDGKFSPDFSTRLPDDMKEHAATLAKFQGVPLPDVLKSYASLQQLVGKKTQAPAPDAKPEDIAAWRKITGAPDTPEGYKIEKPADMPAGQWNPDLANGFAAMAHKHHLSPAAANDLVSWWNEQQAAAIQQNQAYVQEFRDTAEASLKKDWGDKFEVNARGAQRVATIAGLDVNDPEIGNNPAVIRALHAVSNLISDDKRINGGASPGIGLSKTQEADDIQRNVANPFYADYHGKNGAERQAAAADRVRKLRMMGAA